MSAKRSVVVNVRKKVVTLAEQDAALDWLLFHDRWLLLQNVAEIVRNISDLEPTLTVILRQWDKQV
jgi:hypothetical protein